MTLHVVLVSAYHGGSHRAWAEGLQRHSRHRITLVTHEPQAWTWRLTGGFVTLAEQVRAACRAAGAPDVLLATSMVDLAGLLGMLRADLGDVPAALYMHENQITQPNLGRARVHREHALITWTSLVAADAIAFNSVFHRDAVLDALPDFLGWYPDRRHGHLVPGVVARSTVLPVGIELAAFEATEERRGGSPLILWNHRWDEDKDPGAALAALVDLAAEGLDFQVALTGERFADQRRRHDAAVDTLGARIVADDYLPAAAYREVVRSADIVLSTAHHEFFGISVAEAMYAGAFPVLPARQVYPERIPDDLRSRCLYRTNAEMRDRLRWALSNPADRGAAATRLRAGVAPFGWPVVVPEYDAWLAGVGGSPPAGRTTG